MKERLAQDLLFHGTHNIKLLPHPISRRKYFFREINYQKQN